MLRLLTNPTPSSTFVISYILLFCTFKLAAASLRSREPVKEERIREVNFFVRRPREES